PVKKVHVPFFDKVVHIILYAGLGAIVFELMLAHRPAEKLSMIFLFSLVCCSIYGALDEIHQKYVPGRTCSFGDFLADTAGTALGAYIAKLNSLRKKQ
ncbi:MAG: VanZ family protein, partial [bacterium]